MKRFVLPFACLSLLFAGEIALAADPALARVMPRGATRGKEVEITLAGNNLADAQDILFYEPGITVKQVKATDDKSVKATVAIAADARLGEHKLRVRTATGVSQLRTFFVGALPEVEEKEPNNSFDEPQKIDLNVTITGVLKSEDVDYFAIEAKKGQRISVEVEGLRASATFLDPCVAILDPDRFEVAANDDSALLLQEPVLSIVAPKDGKYVVQLRESAYGGSDAATYRLHLGTFPRPTAVYPAGGQTGQELTVNFLGDATPFTQSIKLPAEPNEQFEVLAEQNGQVAPSGNHFRVSPFANVLEAEPNDAGEAATAASGELPLAFNGVIEKPGDVDIFKFNAKKGQAFHVNAFARRLRSPLDPVLSIERNGKAVVGNDDTGGPDSYARLNVPEDGEHTLSIRDHLRQGGPDYVYRVEITPVVPALKLALPFYDLNNSSQERQTIVVPKGNRFATLVRATRADFGGEITLTPDSLPAGVEMKCENVPDGIDVVPVVFEAAADAPVGGKLVDLSAKAAKPDVNVRGAFTQAANLVPNANDAPYYQIYVDKLAVAVAEEAPFKLELIQPKAPLVQGGSMELKVAVTRKEGFTAPIRIQMVYAPPGVTAGTAEIGEGKNEGTVPLNAEAGAAIRKSKIAVLGNSDAPGGRVWVSTQLGDLDVAAPLLAMKMEMATVERGSPGQVIFDVENKTPFEGKAKAKLVGLPANVTANPEEVEFAAGDKTVTFNLVTNEKSPVGQHKSLVCVATVTKDGEPIIHNLARGGVLRVDAPPEAKPAASAEKKPAEAKPAEAKPAGAKPLSRLEQLRQEAAAKQGK